MLQTEAIPVRRVARFGGLIGAGWLAVAALGSLFVPAPLVQATTIVALPLSQPITLALLAIAVLIFFAGRRFNTEPTSDWLAGLIVVAAWYPAAAVALIAFLVGRWSGLGPIGGLAAWSIGIAAGAWSSTTSLGLQLIPALSVALPGFAVASAVASWHLFARSERLSTSRWARWAAAAAVGTVLLAIGGIIENAVATSPESAVVRVVNLGPGTTYVSAYPHELVGGPPAGLGTPLPCGRTLLVSAPRGSHGPWRLYAEPSGESQINGGNSEPFELYGGVPGRPQRVLLAPLQHSWVERWLPSPRC